jgi:hypothetical protein
VAENGFLEYVAHIAVLRPKSYAHFEQHSPSRGAHGAKETSGIASRTARIDAKWQYAPHACFGRQSGQGRSSISRCNVRHLGCEWRSGATRAHPFGIRSLADLAMAQAPLDAIMTRDVAETLASPAVSGGVRELRATQQALGMG